MKKLVSLTLAAAVLCGAIPRIDRSGILPIEETKSPAPGIAPVIFVIGVAAAGAYVVYRLWVCLKAPAPGGIYYWALQKSADHVNWTSVATNGLKMSEEHAWDAFEIDRQADGNSFYRLKMLDFVPIGSSNYVGSDYVICGTEIERPILQP